LGKFLHHYLIHFFENSVITSQDRARASGAGRRLRVMVFFFFADVRELFQRSLFILFRAGRDAFVMALQRDPEREGEDYWSSVSKGKVVHFTNRGISH